MIKVDIINFYDRLKDKWETKSVLFLLVIVLIVSYFMILEYFNVFQVFSNNLLLFLFFPLIILCITIFVWLYSTNRFFFRTSRKITAGVILIVDNEKDKLIIAKIVKKVIHHINNSKAFSNVDLKLLPSNIYTTEKEVEKFHQNYGFFLYDLIIRIFIEAGNFNSIEKIIIEKLSVTYRPKDSEKQKRIFFNIVDLSKDMQLQVGSRDWDYLHSNSGIDNKKYFENIYPIFLYYVGFYAIYVDRFEDALEVMTPIYNSKNTIIPISRKDGNQIEVILNPFNVAEGRLASILVDLFFSVAIKAYHKSETSKALAYFEKLEQIIKTHPNKFYQYINMARFSYELDYLDNAIKYTELANKLKPNSIEVFLNFGFFAILKDDKRSFCENYYRIFKNRKNSTLNWVEILDFQIREQEKLPDKDKYFHFSVSFIEYIFIDQSSKDNFKLVVESYKDNISYNCFYELGRKIMIEEIKNPNSRLASRSRKRK